MNSEEQEKIKILEEENASLKEKIASFKALEEELAAKRIYDLAYKRILALLTFGGLFTVLLGFVGYKIIIQYAEDQAKSVAQKMDSIAVMNMAKDNISKVVIPIGKQEIKLVVHNFMDSFAPAIKNQITDQVLTSTRPLNATKTKSRYDTFSHSDHPVPSSFDISKYMPPVRNEGEEGAAVGFALAAAMEFSIWKEDSEKVILSPRYIYNSIKKGPGDPGAYITDGLHFLLNIGAVEESAWPYKPGEFNEKPPVNISNATHFRITAYETVNTTVADFKSILSSETPIIVGMSIYSSYMTPQVAKTGIFPNYQPGFTFNGGIAVVITGYDDEKKLMKFRICWGTQWGNNGYGYFSYSDLGKIISESYVISGITK